MQYFEMCCNHSCEHVFKYKHWLMSHRKTVEEDQHSPTTTTITLPLSPFASSHHMAEVSQHSIPYWAKLKRSLLSLNLGFRGTPLSLFPLVTVTVLPPPVCCMQKNPELSPHSTWHVTWVSLVSVRIFYFSGFIKRRYIRNHSKRRGEGTERQRDDKGGKIDFWKIESGFPMSWPQVSYPAVPRVESVTEIS